MGLETIRKKLLTRVYTADKFPVMVASGFIRIPLEAHRILSRLVKGDGRPRGRFVADLIRDECARRGLNPKTGLPTKKGKANS